jgi:hypothetical protein
MANPTRREGLNVSNVRAVALSWRPVPPRAAGVHAVAERANSLLKTTFKALRRISLDPNRIGAIVKAALVLRHLEYNRTG